MSQDNKKSFVMYQGDGSNNVFSVPMTKGKYGTISVAFVRRGLDQYEYNPDTWGLNGGLFAWDLSGVKVYTDTATPAIGATIYDQYGVDTGDTVTAVGGATITVNTDVYTRDTLHDVDENTVLTWTGDTLQIGDYIVIERTTTRTQPFEFQNNQKHIEKSDDNLERQIQEMADKVDNALLVDPTHVIDSNKMNPVEWMETILRSVDKSVRGFRYLNGWLDYSLDDPNIADVDKTWKHLLNTDNIKGIRERSYIEEGITYYYTEYLSQDGSWRVLSNQSVLEKEIQQAVDTADEAYALAESLQTTMGLHINNTQNPHQTSMANLTDTDLSDAESGQFLQFDGIKWKAVYSTASVSWGGILGDIDDQADLKNALDGKVEKAGDTMTGALNIANIASSNTALLTLTHSNTATYKWNIAPRYNSTTLSVYPGTTETNGFRFATTGFVPSSNNARYLGSASLKWKGVYTGALNNGADLVVPNKAGTLATMDDVELAARSGTQLTDQGVWYAKMYAATVAPAAENGTNYADFSQVDEKGNPIIVTYNRVNGAWVEDQTITPPTEYDGYITVTSKIWDIAEQAGQQGGRVLWSHTSREFTPYPLIVSFEDINVTGNSTVDMPQNPGANQIVNKDYVDEAIASIPTPTVDVTQSIDAEIYGSVTVSGNDISNFSTGDYVRIPGVFQFKDASSFEIVGAFTTNANSGSQMILCPTNGWLRYMMSGIRIMNSLTDGQQLLHVTIWPDKTTTLTSQSFRGTTNLAANTKYYIKLTYDGTDYKLYLSTDGVNYALEASDTATYLPETNTNGYYLGPRPDSTGTMIAILHMDTWSIKKDAVTVWAGVDAPGLHQRAESSHEVIAFQMPTANNNYTWYRKYADGWVEQGGNVTATSDASYNVALPVTMANNKYTVFVTRDNGSQDHGEGSINARWCEVWSRTTSSFYTWGIYGDSTDFSWQVSGMAQG